MLQKLWNDDAGALLSMEFVIIATLAVCGIVVGWSAVRVAVVTELADVASAIGVLDQSYSFGGVTGHHAVCSGTQFVDSQDDCDDVSCTAVGGNSRCVTVCVTHGAEN